jgi:hypothetical protein
MAAGATLGALRHVGRMIAQERKRVTQPNQEDYLDGLDFAAKIVAGEIDRIATFTGAGYPSEGHPTERGPRHVHVTIPAPIARVLRWKQ